MAGFRASERGFSEADLERALDPLSNVALLGPEWELIFVHLQHSFRQEGQQVVYYIRTFLAYDEVARFVFGQAFARGHGFWRICPRRRAAVGPRRGACVERSVMFCIQGLQAWRLGGGAVDGVSRFCSSKFSLSQFL
jgi:hypothetical protein